MRSPLMVIAEICGERAAQGLLMEDDHVIQALAANRADDSFHIGALPGRTRCGQHLLDSHRLHLLDEVMAEDPVAISQQVTRSAVPRKRFPELMSGPLGRRM